MKLKDFIKNYNLDDFFLTSIVTNTIYFNRFNNNFEYTEEFNRFLDINKDSEVIKSVVMDEVKDCKYLIIKINA